MISPDDFTTDDPAAPFAKLLTHTVLTKFYDALSIWPVRGDGAAYRPATLRNILADIAWTSEQWHGLHPPSEPADVQRVRLFEQSVRALQGRTAQDTRRQHDDDRRPPAVLLNDGMALRREQLHAIALTAYNIVVDASDALGYSTEKDGWCRDNFWAFTPQNIRLVSRYRAPTHAGACCG